MLAAHGAADALSAQRREALHDEAQRLQRSLAEQTRREVFEIARRALADLAGAGLEQRLAEVFVQKLAAIDLTTRDSLAAALNAPGAQPEVRSAFELPKAAQQAVHSAIAQALGTQAHIDFVIAPALSAGIEFSVGGRKLAWGIDAYLQALQRNVAELLDPPAASKSATSPA